MIRSRLPSPARVQWHPKHSCCSLAAKTSHSSLQFWGAAIQLLPLGLPDTLLLANLFQDYFMLKVVTVQDLTSGEMEGLSCWERGCLFTGLLLWVSCIASVEYYLCKQQVKWAGV